MTLVPLRTPPPTMTSPVTVHVAGSYGVQDGSNSAVRVANYSAPGAGSGTDINAAGRDLVIIADGPVNTALKIHNARNVKWIGGEFNIDRPWVDPNGWKSGTMPYDNASDPGGWLNGPRNAVQAFDITGHLFVEGLLLRGDTLIDCFKLARINRFTVQATRGEMAHSDSLGSGPNWTKASGGFHNDWVQFYDYVRRWDMDWCTALVNFQGIMLRTSGSTSGDHKYGAAYWSRSNLASSHARGLNSGDNLLSGAYFGALNFIPFDYAGGSAYGGSGAGAAPDIPYNIKGPIFTDDVWLDPDPSRYANLQAAVGAGTGTPSAYHPQIVADSETGLQRVWWPNWPIVGGDPSGQLMPGGPFFGATDARYFRQGPPRPTLAHPENPSGDYALASEVGMSYVSPGYIGVLPPDPVPDPVPTPGDTSQSSSSRHGVRAA